MRLPLRRSDPVRGSRSRGIVVGVIIARWRRLNSSWRRSVGSFCTALYTSRVTPEATGCRGPAQRTTGSGASVRRVLLLMISPCVELLASSSAASLAAMAEVLLCFACGALGSATTTAASVAKTRGTLFLRGAMLIWFIDLFATPHGRRQLS